MKRPSDSPFYRYKDYLVQRHGKPLYRIPVDLSVGCPNREPDGSGGCTFCPADGGRAKYTIPLGSVDAQVDGAIAFARSRYKADGFMAYFQAFTPTFASPAEQRSLYDNVLNRFPFDAVSIGARPDCLSDDTLEYLQELNERLEVWVELGIQTVHDRTLQRIRRGHDWAASREAIQRLDERGIHIGVHVILGLPGETASDFAATAESLACEPIDAIKIHNLHIMRGTDLATSYAVEPFPVFDEHAYGEVLIDFLRRLPPYLPIMRVNTDTPADELIAPRWEMKKPQFINYVTAQMRKRKVRQGDMCRPRMLLHVCCGPCASQSVRALGEQYGVTLYFSNSNIAPVEEYERRLDAARQLAAICELPLIEDDYDHAAWREKVRGLEDEAEGGLRCAHCFGYNLGRAEMYARANGFHCFTTTLSVSPHKSTQMIFDAARQYRRFVPVDLKKNDGFRKSLSLSEDMGLYRQNYCGCEFSRRGT